MEFARKNWGIMSMIFSIIAVVFFTSMFDSIFAGIADLWEKAGIDALLLFPTVLRISPSLLLLIGVVGLGALYIIGFKQVAAKDANGLIRIVMSVMEIILFIYMFDPIVDSFITLNGSANATWIIFDITTSIVPTLFWLSLFGGTGYQAYSGVRAMASRKKGKGKGNSPAAAQA